MSLQENIDIMCAFRDGIIVESRQIGTQEWRNIQSPMTAAGCGRFNFAQYEFRIAPPKPEVMYKVKTDLGYMYVTDCPCPTDTIIKTYVEKVE